MSVDAEADFEVHLFLAPPKPSKHRNKLCLDGLFCKFLECVRTHLNASERIQTHPNASEHVRTGPNTIDISKNWEKLGTFRENV